MTDDDACVVDTNVLVYSTVSGNPWHQQARQWLSEMQSAGVRLCITTQILREYVVVLTRGAVFENSFEVDQVLRRSRHCCPVLLCSMNRQRRRTFCASWCVDIGSVENAFTMPISSP